MTNEVEWYGASGNRYAFTICSLGAQWKDIGGIYIFTKVVGSTWVPIYIGQTNSFKDRLTPSHEKWECVVIRNGATHIHARVETTEATRLAIEADLIAQHGQKC